MRKSQTNENNTRQTIIKMSIPAKKTLAEEDVQNLLLQTLQNFPLFYGTLKYLPKEIMINFELNINLTYWESVVFKIQCIQIF